MNIERTTADPYAHHHWHAVKESNGTFKCVDESGHRARKTFFSQPAADLYAQQMSA